MTMAPARPQNHGASRAHSQHEKPPGFRQPKRVGQYAIKRLLAGEPGKAEAYARNALEKWPDDAEMHFVLALAAGADGRLAEAEAHMERALQAGVAPGRFVAGPRELIEPLKNTPIYRRIVREVEEGSGLLHGPMIGGVSDSMVRLWVRTPGGVEVQARVASDPKRLEEAPKAGADQRIAASERVTPAAERDYTATLVVDGLQPDTEYHYGLLVDGEFRQPEREQCFRTAPRPGDPVRFRFAFGGGAGYTPGLETMWDTIGSFEPDLMLLLGDNVYSDDPKSPALQRYSYYRRQSRPEWRRLVAHTPVVTIWDDHDFSNNDSWGGPKAHLPEWKPRVWEVFRQNWANPGYGGGREHPGCWYDFQVGDVHFIMLDCRYYRTSPKLPKADRSMLGPVQKQWLKKTLASSEATIKVLASSVPWDFRTKGNSPDTWNGYRAERHEIFSHLREERIEGVVLISADRHRSDAWRIDEGAGKPEGMYDLYEFNSSRLTNRHVHREQKEAIFSYNEKQSFGLVHIDTSTADPAITYEVVNIDGEPVEKLTLRRSRLGW